MGIISEDFCEQILLAAHVPFTRIGKVNTADLVLRQTINNNRLIKYNQHSIFVEELKDTEFNQLYKWTDKKTGKFKSYEKLWNKEYQ